MESKHRTRHGRGVRFVWLFMVVIALVGGAAFWGNSRVEANHPVLLEGNCDSPVPGTTIVEEGTCGDFDGDGRIGTAEDTDGADRIFGTLKAALGPGTGAAAGTGANQNGTIMIVSSGRFAEGPMVIGNPAPSYPGAGGVGNPGNVTIEAAPGVIADFDAVLQGDPAGGNTSRQNNDGIVIHYLPDVADRTVTLRNLTIRNYNRGVLISAFNSVLIDNCRIVNNLATGVTATNGVKLVIMNSVFEGNGKRIGSGVSTVPGPGTGLEVQSGPLVRIMNSVFANNAGPGISQTGASTVTLYKVGTFFNNPDTVGAVTVAPNPNFAQ